MQLRLRCGALVLTLLSLLPIVQVGQPHPVRAAAPAAPTSISRAAQAKPVRWGFYITYNPNSLESLQANARYLNYVSPWFYYVNNAGQVTGKDQAAASSIIRAAGALSLPMLKNDATYNDFTPILTDTLKQASIVDQIDSIVMANGYDGITIDFEALNPADKPFLTAFMGTLSERLHARGKLVAMAVPAKVKDTTTGWSAPYDFAALGKVVDYMLVMGYDFHWVTSDPGPIAPIAKLRETAAYTTSRVPASKVVWGVGVYGYDWGKLPTGETDGKPAEYRNFAEVAAISALPDAQSGYDEESQSPWVQYSRDGLPREVWFENRRSFDAKLALVAQYGMAGFGIWRIGQEDPAIWKSIASVQKPTACLRVNASAATKGRVYFAETGHTLGGVFLSYWRAHGGLPVYGYPLTEEFTEVSPTDNKRYTVQYFERNRFEYHPENKPPNNVLLGLLGVQVTTGRFFPPADDPTTGVDTLFFPQLRHTMSGPFLRYWQKYGGLAQFGYPISEPVLETSTVDGKSYIVQYMERARFEYHAEYRGTDAEVLLGLLGRDVFPCN